MKRVEYIVDRFVDYTGNTRQFVMAAVSLQGTNDVYVEENGEIIPTDGKVLSIGVAVCRPNDDFNEGLGMKIAEGKATKYRTHALYAVDAGLINETMVRSLLVQEADYFKVNPGRYLAGYDKDAAKYRECTRIEGFIDNMEGTTKIAFDHLTDCSDKELRDLIEAVNYVTVE